MDKTIGNEQKRAYATPVLSEYGTLIDTTQRLGGANTDLIGGSKPLG